MIVLVVAVIAALSTHDAIAAKVDIMPVMTEGMASNDCAEKPCAYAAFRIPGLVAVPPSTLLAFAARHDFARHCCIATEVLTYSRAVFL